MFSLKLGDDAKMRLLELRDAKELCELIERNHNHLQKWMTWLSTRSNLQETEKFITKGLENYAKNNGREVGIWHKDKLAGVIGYHEVDHISKRTSLGYWLGEEFQGKGLMIRAARAMVDYAFLELKLNRVELRCATENSRSKRIAEKLGFVKEGELRQAEWLTDHFVNNEVYSVLSQDWKKETR